MNLAVTPAAFSKRQTELRIVVVGPEGEPVARASVVVSRLKGKQLNKVKGDPLQLKTSLQGTAPLPPLDQGWYMLQVISSGYQTYGGKVQLEEPEQTVTIELSLPQDQFSVHTDQ